MCNLVKNIESKSQVIVHDIKTKEDTYKVIKAISEFKGAVIQHHILEFFDGDTNKGLEDIVANTNEDIGNLKKSMRANIDRVNAIAEAERQERGLVAGNLAKRS